jgi:epoxide hydrolase
LRHFAKDAREEENDMTTIHPFTLAIDQSELDALQTRLAATRWPDAETAKGWDQGVPLENMRALVDHWRHRYDWRRCEKMLNSWNQNITEIDGLDIHFCHIRSPHENALPLIMTHGWPGSIVEFSHVVGPLTNPTAHGGKAEDAFHLILPTLPGYGFSGKPDATGWNIARIGKAWAELMHRLGYGDHWVAQGGDWGSVVTTTLGMQEPAGLKAIHVNMAIARPTPEEVAAATPRELDALGALQYYATQGNGYSQQQKTRPQTLGYALADSPVGQAAWIFEKFREWGDAGDAPESAFGLDHILDNVMMYWLSNSGASSARLYWESFDSFGGASVNVPAGASIFPKEIFRPSRRWAEKTYTNIVYWNELDRGGHFAAFEVPDLFVPEVRSAFRGFRAG